MTTLNLTADRGFSAQPASSTGMLGATPQDPSGQPSSPYTQFSKNLMSLLSSAQNTANPNPLLQSREQLTNQSLNLSNPMNATPYSSLFAAMTPSQSVNGQAGTQSSFNPGLSSITDQLNAANQNLTSFQNTVQTAYDINKPIPVSAGTSLYSPSGELIVQGGKYTPTFNYQKGIMDGYDSVTGTWASDNGGGTGSGNADSTPQTTGSQFSGGTIVGGVDFSGRSTGVGAYATDPNYSAEVGGIYNGLQATIPSASVGSQAIDMYIKGHAKSSPVTGQMIMNAANQYAVDPLLLTAVLAHESDFGTAGAATSTMNAGNVGNTGTSTRAYNSWQAGVSAAANELARRKAPAGQPQTAPTQSMVGGQFSTDASARVAQLPQWVQKYAQAGPKGVAYINDDRVPGTQQQKDAIKTFAAQYGIPYVSASDASMLQALDTVYQNLDQMDGIVQKNLGNGFMGGVGNIVGTIGNNLTFGNANPELDRLNNFKDTAIKTVQGLAGGAGSGLRINGDEIAAQLKTLPSSTDTLDHANTKLNQVRSFLDQKLSSIFPYVKPSASATGMVQMTGPQGTFNVPAAQVDLFKQNGYK